MIKYLAYVRSTFFISTTYRWQVFWELAASVFTIVFYVFLWSAVFRSSNTIGGMTVHEIILYYILAQVITSLTLTRADRTVSREISRGTILNRLIRPAHVYWQVMAGEIGGKLWKAITNVVPVLLFSAVFIGLSFPRDASTYIFFAGSLVFAFLIGYNINFLAGLSAAWITGSEGITHTKDFIVSICTGALLPLSFYPAFFQQVFAFLPFKYMLYIPYQIVSGAMDPAVALEMLGQAAIWGIVLTAINLFLLGRGVRRIVIYGG